MDPPCSLVGVPGAITPYVTRSDCPDDAARVHLSSYSAVNCPGLGRYHCVKSPRSMYFTVLFDHPKLALDQSRWLYWLNYRRLDHKEHASPSTISGGCP